jgi:hypothetical protein
VFFTINLLSKENKFTKKYDMIIKLEMTSKNIDLVNSKFQFTKKDSEINIFEFIKGKMKNRKYSRKSRIFKNTFDILIKIVINIFLIIFKYLNITIYFFNKKNGKYY